MKLLFYFLFVFTVVAQVCPNSAHATTIDYKGSSQYEGRALNKLECNAQTRIDFNFGQSASDDLNVTYSSVNYYTFDNSSNSNLQFLNRNGNELRYTLAGISINPYGNGNSRVFLNNIKTNPDYQLSVTFTNQENKQNTVVSIFILKSDSIITEGDSSIIVEGQKVFSQINGFYNLVKSFNNASQSGVIKNIAGGLSYLQKPDLSQFITVRVQPEGCDNKINFLVSGLIIKLPQDIDFLNISTTTTFTYTNNQAQTGNILCFGSQSHSNVFQTHMRESYPLWAAWFTAVLFWISIFIGQSRTNEANHDRNFENNRWTSWQIYSLWNLAHEDFFPRIMRSTAYFSSFWINGLICSSLIVFVGTNGIGPIITLFFGIAGCFGSFIFSFFSGFFLTKYSKWSLLKYVSQKHIKNSKDKQSVQVIRNELQIDKCEDRLYIYFFWFYVLTIIILIVCWTLCIHFMQLLPRHDYYLMYYWLGSTGIGICLYTFILTPLWSLLAGNYAIAQIRGFWYDYKLAQTYKQIQD